MVDKATQFRIKIASKNQLRALLRQKREVYNSLDPDSDVANEVLKEMDAIKVQIASYD